MPAGSHMVVSADDRNVNFNSITFTFDGDVTLDAGGNSTLENGVWTAPAPEASAAYGPMQAPSLSNVRSVTFTNSAETPARVKTMTINYTSTTTGIEQTETVVVAEPVYFDLQGRRVDNAPSGLYIRVTGDKTDKVLVK